MGEILLQIPNLQSGSCFPNFLEPQRQAQQALLTLIQAAYVAGVSIDKVEDLVQSLGLTGID